MNSAWHTVSLVFRALFYSAIAWPGQLPGRYFELFGRKLAWRKFWGAMPALEQFLNPVSSVRYFEFDFAHRAIGDDSGLRILDVGSPTLFGFYCAEKRQCEYHYVNLDRREIEAAESSIKHVRVKGTYSASVQNATTLEALDEYYSHVVCISVIEHIPNNGDSLAIAEMWRVLRPGGRLILTVPVSEHYEEQHRPEDQYQIGVPETDGQYFFQRLYDQDALQRRLLDRLPGAKIQSEAVYGEKIEGFFSSYESRWRRYGLQETIKDPYLMSRDMKKFRKISSLPGMGVLGIALLKDISGS